MPKNVNGQNDENELENEQNINQMGEFVDENGIEDEEVQNVINNNENNPNPERQNEEPVNAQEEAVQLQNEENPERQNEEAVNVQEEAVQLQNEENPENNLNQEDPENNLNLNQENPENNLNQNLNQNQANPANNENPEEVEEKEPEANPQQLNNNNPVDDVTDEERKERERKQKEAAMLLAKKINTHVGMKDMSNESFEKHKGIAAAALAGINTVDPGYVVSSGAFRYFKGSLEEVDRQAKKLSNPPTAGQLRRYSNAHRTLLEDCDYYLDYKRGKKMSKLASKRVAFVEEKKKFAQTNRDFWHAQYLESIKITDTNTSQLIKNSENVQDLYKDLKDVDPFYVKSSKEFKQVKKSMEELKKLAQEMGPNPSEAQLRKYVLATKRLERACDKYQIYKGEPDSSRAVKRLDMVADVKEFAIKNQQDFTQIAKNMGYEFEFADDELKFEYELEEELEKKANQTEKEPEAEENELEANNENPERQNEEPVNVQEEAAQLQNEENPERQNEEPVNVQEEAVQLQNEENPERQNEEPVNVQEAAQLHAEENPEVQNVNPEVNAADPEVNIVNPEIRKAEPELKNEEPEVEGEDIAFGEEKYSINDDPDDEPVPLDFDPLIDDVDYQKLNEDRLNEAVKQQNEKQAELIKQLQADEVLAGIIFEKEIGDNARIKSLDQESMLKNAANAGEMIDELEADELNNAEAGDEFRRMKSTAMEVKQLADNMSQAEGEPANMQLNKYIRKNNELKERINDYLGADSTKRDLENNDVTTVNRVEHAMRLKEFSRINADSLQNLEDVRDNERFDEMNMKLEDRAKDEKEIDATKASIEYNKKVDLADPEFRNVYVDEKDIVRMDNPHGYSVDYNAIPGLAQLYLMADDEEGKYSLEDLADPTKFVEEKKEAAREVMDHIENGSPEDQMWIGAVIYAGQKNGMKLIDDYTQNLDVTHPDFVNSEQCANIGNICQAINEGNKALPHCKEEFVDVVKEMTGKNINYDRYRQDVKDRTLFIDTLTGSARDMHKSMDKLEREPENEQARQELIHSSYKMTLSKNMIKEGLESRENATITKLFEDKKMLRNARSVYNEAVMDENVNTFISKLSDDKELFNESKGKLLSGKIFDNMGLKEKDGNFKSFNAPTVEGLKRDNKYNYIADAKLDRAVEKANKENKELLDKTDNPNQKEFLAKVNGARERLLALSKKDTDLTAEEVYEADKCMKEIVAENFLKYAKENSIKIPDQVDDFTSRVSEMPEFQKSTQFVSKGSIKEFLAEDKGNAIIKNTLMAEKEKADRVRDDELADNMNPEAKPAEKSKDKEKNKKKEEPGLGGPGL